MRDSRGLAISASAATYAAAFCVALVVVRGLSFEHPLLRLGVGTVVATVVVFAVSVLVDNSSMYDPYWSLQPLAIAACYLWWLRPEVSGRGILVTVLILVYALRLTANFFRGWRGLSQEDFRYRALRGRFGRSYWPVSFLGIHLFPTVMVWLGCLPLYVVMRTGRPSLGWADIPATLICFGAVCLALAADEQMRRFRKDPAHEGRHISRGLWSRVRHPNYLGEIAWWWGVWVFALAAAPGAWWAGTGAVAITLMFVYVSVPMMEARTLATRAGYERYRKRTPMLLPSLRRRLTETDAG
jgi:steroid 5-alpha reductase family enzyme